MVDRRFVRQADKITVDLYRVMHHPGDGGHCRTSLWKSAALRTTRPCEVCLADIGRGTRAFVPNDRGPFAAHRACIEAVAHETERDRAAWTQRLAERNGHVVA